VSTTTKARASALFCLVLLLGSTTAHGQVAAKVHRIGWMSSAPHPFIADFRDGMRRLGYIEGANLVIDERYADGKADRLPTVVAELVRAKPNVIFASGRGAVAAAHKGAGTIPVVFVTGDPQSDRFVATLSRPGGNMTGIALLNTDLGSKWIELVKEIVPTVSRVALLQDPSASLLQARTAQEAARSLGLEVHIIEARDRAELENAFRAATSLRVQAMVGLSSATYAAEKHYIIGLASEHRVPFVYEHRDFVESGGLISYGPDLREVFRRAAVYVDRIIKGARAGELPVEQPTKFELVINLTTARALGLTLPPRLLVRADQIMP
jgi:putative tryptophan/tyrosine transport system substrate-binding protein